MQMSSNDILKSNALTKVQIENIRINRKDKRYVYKKIIFS